MQQQQELRQFDSSAHAHAGARQSHQMPTETADFRPVNTAPHSAAHAAAPMQQPSLPNASPGPEHCQYSGSMMQPTARTVLHAQGYIYADAAPLYDQMPVSQEAALQSTHSSADTQQLPTVTPGSNLGMGQATGQDSLAVQRAAVDLSQAFDGAQSTDCDARLSRSANGAQCAEHYAQPNHDSTPQQASHTHHAAPPAGSTSDADASRAAWQQIAGASKLLPPAMPHAAEQAVCMMQQPDLATAGPGYGFQDWAEQAAGHLAPTRLFAEAATSIMAEQLPSGSMGINRQVAGAGSLLSSGAHVEDNAQPDMVPDVCGGAALQHRAHASPNAARLAFAR